MFFQMPVSLRTFILLLFDFIAADAHQPDNTRFLLHKKFDAIDLRRYYVCLVMKTGFINQQTSETIFQCICQNT